jgi:hypothetical protein
LPAVPAWPAIEFYRFSEERYKSGIITVTEGENSFQIYDIEKTVCDIIFYRNKLGFEPAIEILKNYVQCRNRDLNKLMKYASKLHVGKIISEYTEIII